jgi:glycosyltransferase involved in cell wall biosynthesis
MPLDKIAVTVIIPVFNADDTIMDLINLVCEETRINIEVIIINDGSVDDTTERLKTISDDRVIIIEQENKGVYFARNVALKIHKGEWVIFLDADDRVSKGFIYERLQLAKRERADVVIFNAWHAGAKLSNIHNNQPYGKRITGFEWIKHCVKHHEWPHYLWLQIVKSEYIKKCNIFFQTGSSHKDILWTIDLAINNGIFYISDKKDYTYIDNPFSITHRTDYYDARAVSYIEVISKIINYAYRPGNKAIKEYLLRHSLAETRQFLGLYRKKVNSKNHIREIFNKEISIFDIAKGIHSISDVFFFVKLAYNLLYSHHDHA